jgi:serine/threonine protein phosphatase PrpC
MQLCVPLRRRLVEVDPGVSRWRLQPGDSFAVLASDGLWDVMGDQDAVDIASEALHRAALNGAAPSGGPLPASDSIAKAAADALVQVTCQCGGCVAAPMGGNPQAMPRPGARPQIR